MDYLAEIRKFSEALIGSDMGHRIAKIVWFGSTMAQEFHHSASDAIQRGDDRLGLDGAYNSAELAVKGLLVTKMADLPGSHGGIAQRFGEVYVKSGEVQRAMGRRLNRCLELRNATRYKFTAKISREDAMLALGLAEELIDILEKKLAGLEKESS
jgi:uncharacterized protein (UPF0332 family)